MSVIKIRDKETGEFIDIPALQGESGIPVPATAKVGQTIVVKSVDANGKPTAWEAADLPSGGGADLMLFHLSSWPLLSIDGMTWEEWVASKYNTCGVYCEAGYVYDKNEDIIAVQNTDNPELQSHRIIAGEFYATL